MIAILYLPVLHQGYLEFFKKYNDVDVFYVLGESIIDLFPELKREIRRINPKKMCEVISAAKFFKKVEVLELNKLKTLSGTEIITSSESEIKALIKKYLPNNTVQYDSVFLRWDSSSVSKLNVVINDSDISKNKFDKEIINVSKLSAENSSDWFRQVGAVLVRDKKIIMSSFNERKPSRQAVYSEGDPRNFLELGSNTSLRNTIHAEQKIITQAAREGISIKGTHLYVTTFPCPDCASLIAESGIEKCYYSEGYSQLDGEKVLKSAGVKIIKVI